MEDGTPHEQSNPDTGDEISDRGPFIRYAGCDFGRKRLLCENTAIVNAVDEGPHCVANRQHASTKTSLTAKAV